jgi:hypothetical protein
MIPLKEQLENLLGNLDASHKATNDLINNLHKHNSKGLKNVRHSTDTTDTAEAIHETANVETQTPRDTK